jgi:hypothetical protein
MNFGHSSMRARPRKSLTSSLGAVYTFAPLAKRGLRVSGGAMILAVGMAFGRSR